MRDGLILKANYPGIRIASEQAELNCLSFEREVPEV